MKKYISIFFASLLCLQNAYAASNSKYIPARYVVLAGEIKKEMAIKYAKKYQMIQICDRAGLMRTVNLLGFDFQIRGPLSQERLREILIDCVEGFLEALNNNVEIRPFLETYPYTAKGLDIGIFIMDSTGKKDVYYPSIGVARAYEGKLVYRLYDPASEYYQNKERIEESYEDALKIVKKSHTNLSNATL